MQSLAWGREREGGDIGGLLSVSGKQKSGLRRGGDEENKGIELYRVLV